MLSKNIRIKGRVQGVFFRANAQEKAKEFGVTGWVRNAPDESVEIHAEGDDQSLKKFIEWCREGPEGAEVASIDIRDAEAENCTSFEIQR